jgi:hypothetical protein
MPITVLATRFCPPGKIWAAHWPKSHMPADQRNPVEDAFPRTRASD